MKAPWPLVGRTEELVLLGEAMTDPSIRGIVLAGKAGVGKTRLAQEAINGAKERGAYGRWFVATQSAASVPFSVFAALLQRAELSGDAPLRLVLEASRSLALDAGDRPVVIGVDDGHRLDDASATFVHQLAVSGQAFVVVTIRSGEPVPDPITALWKDGLAERVEIQPLARDEMEILVRAALGGAVDRSTLDQLWTWTEGNALFLREILYGGADRGALAPLDGVWRWTGPVYASPRLREVLDTRLGGLGSAERGALECLALAEPVGVDMLAELVTLGIVERLEATGLIQVDLDGRRVQARLVHPLYAEVLRSEIPAIRARAVCRQLAEALETTGARRRDDVVRAALWRLDAGGRSDPELLLAAARRVAYSFSLALAERITTGPEGGRGPSGYELGVTEDLVAAERLARAAWESTGRFDAGLALGQILMWQKRDHEAGAVLGRLSDLAVTEDQRGGVAYARARLLFFGFGRTDEAEELVGKAEATATTDAHRNDLATIRAGFVYNAGRPLDALAIASDVLARPGVSGFALARSAVAAAGSLILAGRSGQALDLLDQHLPAALALATDEPLVVGVYVLTRFMAWRLEGRLADAQALAKPCYQLALAQDSVDGTAVFGASLGLLALGRGDLAAAVAHLREADALYRDRDLFNYRPWCLAALAQALAMGGDLDGAARALAESDGYGSRALGQYRTEVELARAWVTAIGGNLSQALAVSVDAAARAGAAGAVAYEALALHTAARLGGAGRVAGRLAALAPTIDGDACALYADHAAALERDDGAALSEVAEGFDRLGSPLLAAEAAAAAAQAYRRAGRQSSARAAGARAEVFANRCPGVWTPGLAQPSRGPALTRREREVATMASRGRANADIAAELYLSVRTVETHLQAVYRKLGVNTRQELAALLDTRRP